MSFINALLFSAVTAAAAANPNGYYASQEANLVTVKTPWGSTIYLAPVGFDSIRSYSFSVPLGEFRQRLVGDGHAYGHDGNPTAEIGDGSSPPTDLSSLIIEANRLYNRGEFDKALQDVDQINLRDPKNVRGWTMKGSLMHAMGHKDLARDAWQKALDLDPGNAQLQRILKEPR